MLYRYGTRTAESASTPLNLPSKKRARHPSLEQKNLEIEVIEPYAVTSCGMEELEMLGASGIY